MIRGHVARIAPDEHDVAGFDRHVGPRADRDAHVGGHQRRRVVHAVADHRDALALPLELLDLRRLLLGSTSANTVSMPSSCATASATACRIARHHDHFEPCSWRLPNRLARLRADGVRDGKHGEGGVALEHRDRGLPARGRAIDGRRERWVRSRRSSAAQQGRPADSSCLSVDDRLHAMSGNGLEVARDRERIAGAPRRS